MSRRVTRSSAKKSADISLSTTQASADLPHSSTQGPTAPSRKRKALTGDPAIQESGYQVEDSASRTKRRKQSQRGLTSIAVVPNRKRKGGQNLGMSSSEAPDSPSEEESASVTKATSSKKKPGKSGRAPPDQQQQATARLGSSSRSRNSSGKKSNRATVAEVEEQGVAADPSTADNDNPTDEDEAGQVDGFDEDETMGDDPFSTALLSRVAGMTGSMRALQNMMAASGGSSSRIRSILESLRQYDDPSTILVALQELAQLLLMASEETLAGNFSPDLFLKELIKHMEPNELFPEDNVEIMLLACRCIANMMEAIPASTTAVVYTGAVPVLVSKLLAIQYVDLAEQALITLEKISSEFPASIVREGGLTACLTFLDFFATGVQRTAVTTAANCCRNIPEESFQTVKEVMPILLNVLCGNDQRVVESGCLCVTRIVESFRFKDDKLEELMSAELLRAILGLLLPGSTNMIGSHIHTQFLHLLGTIARASPNLTVELLKMNVVETLYQILTGVSPPSGMDDVAQKIDSVVVMQALIHRPREQIYETLNVICELLPALEPSDSMEIPDHTASHSHATGSRHNTRKHRLELLSQCKSELRRFAVVLLPTLTDAYSSTVNLNVRRNVLTAQMKMLSFLDTDILEEALRPVPFASYLASILSQQDHPDLVIEGLRAAAILLKRLEHIYRYQFYREGMVTEVKKLAERPLEAPPMHSPEVPAVSTSESAPHADSDEDDGDLEEEHDHEDDDSTSDDETGPSYTSAIHFVRNNQDTVTRAAQTFMELCDSELNRQASHQAAAIMEDLRNLVSDIGICYDSRRIDDGARLFSKLATYFEGDAVQSITSYELLTSKIVSSLLEVFEDLDNPANRAARTAFIEVFMSSSHSSRIDSGSLQSSTTPFGVLVQKLQDLLSRAEHFEVLTVHSNPFDNNRSSAASMLAKQIKIKLIADDESGIPRTYRNVSVSIHAIATFKALDDYLRPRIALSERARLHASNAPSAAATSALVAAMSGGELPEGFAADNSPASRSAAASKTRTENRKSSKPKNKDIKDTGASDEASSSTVKRPSNQRKTSRKSKPAVADAASSAMPPPPPSAEEDALKTAIECVDETPVTDQDEQMEVSGDFDGLVGDLGEDLADESSDPDAVNMEVAATGKVTARQDDGTRIDTPTGTPNTASRAGPPPSATTRTLPTGLPRSLLSSSSFSRSMSYAAALQAIPQDWHLEFTVNGQSISNETTIYRAVHSNHSSHDEFPARNTWGQTHAIHYKRVEGPPPDPSLSPNHPAEAPLDTLALPLSLELNPISAQILRLLRILHEMNSNVDELLIDARPGLQVQPESLSQFVNTKLTAKLNRQLEEPLIVASNCLPSWSEDLARLYPFLFPFETRHLFLQSTSFGYSRSMNKWQSGQTANETRRDRQRDDRPFLGRLQRQKVRIARHKLLESAIKVMEIYGASPSVLEVEFFDEVGTGLGPTLEFYSNVSKEFSKKKLKLWRENESDKSNEYAFGKQGLFPAPMSEELAQTENGLKILTMFKMLGKFVARSMLDSRIIDVSFNPTFFRACASQQSMPLSLGAVKAVDSDLAQSLQTIKQFVVAKRKIDEQTRLLPAQKAHKMSLVQVAGASIDDLGLDFTLPGYPAIELMPKGAQVSVTLENVGMYLDMVIDYTLGKGIQKQVDAFKAGFSQVFPYSAMSAFTPDELVMLFGRHEEDWSIETLMDSTKADHGYNLDSSSVRNLLEAMSEFDEVQRRNFLQFITGSPKLPIGGFKSLTPMFTVVCKPSEAPYTPDDYLPSVMTCVNYLKLPDYSSLDVMKKKLDIAIREGQGAFHLS